MNRWTADRGVKLIDWTVIALKASGCKIVSQLSLRGLNRLLEWTGYRHPSGRLGTTANGFLMIRLSGGRMTTGTEIVDTRVELR